MYIMLKEKMLSNHISIAKHNLILFILENLNLLFFSRPLNNHNHNDSPPTPTLDGIGSLDLVKILP